MLSESYQPRRVTEGPTKKLNTWEGRKKTNKNATPGADQKNSWFNTFSRRKGGGEWYGENLAMNQYKNCKR